MRDEKIDITKAIGIILVIWAHVSSRFAMYIYTFHMPLFFWVSGFLRYSAKDKPFIQFLKSKTKTTIIPYIIFWFLTVVIYANGFQLFYYHMLAPLTMNTLKGLLFGGHWLAETTNNFAIWYLQLYFIAAIIFEIIIRHFNKLFKFLSFILISISTVPFQHFLPGRPAFHINVLPAALSFMLIGYFSKHLIQKKRNYIINKPQSFCISILLLIVGWRISTIHYGDISNINSYLFFIGASLSILGIYILSGFFTNSNFLKYIGSKTLYILGLHGLTFATLRLLTDYIMINLNLKGDLVYSIILAFFALISSCGLAELFFYIKERIKSYKKA